METQKVQTRKNENIITTIVPEEMYQKYLVENLYRTWKERFLDEDTGEVVDVERKEIILERGTFIGDTIRENKGYGDLGFFEQILIESDFEVTLKTATTVNCSAVICREFTMQYNPEAGEKKEEKSKEAPAEASQDGGLFPEEESPQNE